MNPTMQVAVKTTNTKMAICAGVTPGESLIGPIDRCVVIAPFMPTPIDAGCQISAEMAVCVSRRSPEDVTPDDPGMNRVCNMAISTGTMAVNTIAR